MKKIRWSLFVVVALILICMSHSFAQFEDTETQPFKRIYFSTEEDFVLHNEQGVTNIISDGDLLINNGIVFMKNNDLLRNFKEKNDLGLDAIDVIHSKDRLVAFSTELDSAHKIFSAGDLLVSNGALIPNKALLINFQFESQPADIGLDALQFRGEQTKIIKFLYYVESNGWDYYKNDPKRLPEDLKEFDIDIWFSVEGTPSVPYKPLFIDGDLLSVLNGNIVFDNSLLLPFIVPAGLPKRGVDFGLDAFYSPRIDNIEIVRCGFSTEILYFNKDGKLAFTDGDTLQGGTGNILINNYLLINNFKPVVNFLGLDALSLYEK